MRISQADLNSAADRGVINASQADALWRYFNEQGLHQPRFQLSHLLYYLGGLMAISAMSIFITWGWELLGGWAGQSHQKLLYPQYFEQIVSIQGGFEALSR